MPWDQVLPFAPGQPVPISASVNGIPTLQACAAQQLNLAGGAPSNGLEPTTVGTSSGTCAYVFSLYRTPVLTAVPSPRTVGMPGLMTLSGKFLTATAANINVTVAGSPCQVLGLVPSGSLGSTLNCQLPPLPAGTHPVVVWVSGFGYARGPTGPVDTSDSVPPTRVRYSLSVSGSAPRVSYYGGFTLSLPGYGFVPTAGSGNNVSRTMTLQLDDGAQAQLPWLNTLPASSVYAPNNRINLTVPSSSAGSMQLAGPRLPLPAFGSALDPSAKISISTQVAVFDPVLVGDGIWYNDDSASALFDIVFDASCTPKLDQVVPQSLDGALSAPRALTITWSLAVGSGGGLTASPPGTASQARVYLQAAVADAPMYPCSSVMVAASKITATSYTEILSCSFPSSLPAGTYALWLCHGTLGCGFRSAPLTVSLSVSSVTPTSGSFGGGTLLTIASSGGLSTNASEVTVLLGSTPCSVVSSDGATLKCLTGAPVGSAASASMPAPLSISPGPSMPAMTFPSLTFTYDPNLTPYVSAVSPTRGSTEGGSVLQISGSGFDALDVSAVRVLIGAPAAGGGGQGLPALECSGVTRVDANTISCTTPKPPKPRPLGPQPLLVLFPGAWGAGAAGSSCLCWRTVEQLS